MNEKLTLIAASPCGCTGVLKEGYAYCESRVIRADSEEELKAKADAATRLDWWVTMNGSHVLIKGDKIVSGAGGNLNGKRFGQRFTNGARSRWMGNRNTWGGKNQVAGLGASEGKAREVAKITRFADAQKALENIGFYPAAASTMKYLDKKLIIANINNFADLESRFGVVKYLGNVSCAAESMRESGWGGTRAYVDTDLAMRGVNFRFNKKYFAGRAEHLKDMQSSLKHRESMPCAPERYDTYVLTHEYGHLLQNAIYQKELEKRGWSKKKPLALIKDPKDASDPYWEVRLKVQSRCIREIEKIAKRKDPKFRLADHLSSYGMTSYAEAFAEIFANSQCGAPNAAGDAMNIWLKEKGFLSE